MTTLNRLDAKQTYTLCQWVAANTAEFAGKTRKEVAALATERLGFSVSDYNVLNARDITGAKWDGPKPTRANLGPRLSASNSVALARDVVMICESLGLTPSEVTRAIASHKVPL